MTNDNSSIETIMVIECKTPGCSCVVGKTMQEIIENKKKENKKRIKIIVNNISFIYNPTRMVIPGDLNTIKQLSLNQ